MQFAFVFHKSTTTAFFSIIFNRHQRGEKQMFLRGRMHSIGRVQYLRLPVRLTSFRLSAPLLRCRSLLCGGFGRNEPPARETRSLHGATTSKPTKNPTIPTINLFFVDNRSCLESSRKATTQPPDASSGKHEVSPRNKLFQPHP